MNGFKFQVGEVVQLVMGRAPLAHFDGELAEVVSCHRNVNDEWYKLNPVNQKMQQGLIFSVGNLRSIVNGVPEPLSEVHYKRLALSEENMCRKEKKLNEKFSQVTHGRVLR